MTTRDNESDIFPPGEPPADQSTKENSDVSVFYEGIYDADYDEQDAREAHEALARTNRGVPEEAMATERSATELSSQENTNAETVREPPAAAQPATDLMEVLQRAADFDDVLGRVQMYGAADRVRDSWDKLKNAILYANKRLHPPASAVQPATNEQTDYQAALTALPDTLGRPLARRIEIVLEGLRRESHIGCELRRELDGGIERDARAIEAQWPDAAKYLRSHAHIEDGV